MDAVLALATPETVALLLVVTLSITLANILKTLITKYFPKNRVLSDEEFEKLKVIEQKLKTIYSKIEDKPTLNDEQNSMLQELYALHIKTDADGIPLHYFPRSFIEAQKEIVDVLSEISSHQEKLTYILELMMKNQDKIESKLESIRKE